MERAEEERLKKDFKEHIDSLHEVYEKSTLKEKHKLNEHIKHLIKTHGQVDSEAIQSEIVNDSTH